MRKWQLIAILAGVAVLLCTLSMVLATASTFDSPLVKPLPSVPVRPGVYEAPILPEGHPQATPAPYLLLTTGPCEIWRVAEGVEVVCR